VVGVVVEVEVVVVAAGQEHHPMAGNSNKFDQQFGSSRDWRTNPSRRPGDSSHLHRPSVEDSILLRNMESGLGN